jgi:DNA-binding MarR family transcriptional regulator
MISVPYADGMTTTTGIDPLALESQVCFALAVASRRVIAEYRPLLEPMGLTHPQYLVMLALWQSEPLSVRRLGELVSLEPATLSPLLKRLEALGYLRRQRRTDDERTLDVTLTEEGRALRERALAIPPAMMARLGMSVDELQGLHALLSDVIARTSDR